MFAVSPSGLVEARSARSLQNIEYAKVKGTSLLLDAHLPASHTATDAVIIVHGGGWVRGDRHTDVQPLFAPLAEAGIAWFSIDYRLAKNITDFGVAVADVQAAIRFIKSRTREYNINPNRLAIIGESAGGQLAAMAILSKEPAVQVNGFVGLYTPSDLVTLLKEADFLPADLRRFVVGTPWEKLLMSQVKKLSPLQNLAPCMPPTLLIHGTADPLVPFSQSINLADRINQAGGRCELHPVPGAGHGIRWWDDQSYKAKLIQWLRAY